MIPNIHVIHFSVDSKLIDLVKDKSKKIYHFNDMITDVDVYLKLENTQDHIKDKVVEIKVQIKGGEVFSKETAKTFEDALSIAMDSTIVQLKKKKEILKG